jgi:hypothetical protein
VSKTRVGWRILRESRRAGHMTVDQKLSREVRGQRSEVRKTSNARTGSIVPSG